MMRWTKVFLALGALAIAGCETASTDTDNDAAARLRTTEPVSMASEAPDPGALKGYGIPSGRCGMVLWARAGKAAVPIFQTLDSGKGVMEIDGEQATLTRVRVNGVARAGMPQMQVFQTRLSDGRSVEIEANTVWGEAFPGGSYVERGTISLTGSDGWSRVTPVAGIAGCKA